METEKKFRRRLAAAENMAVRQRNYRRARDRALVRLANDYKEIYLDYLAQEKEKDEQEGKIWHDLTGSVPDNRFDAASYYDSEVGITPTQDSESEGNGK